MAELKPCPFCGKTNVIVCKEDGEYQVVCDFSQEGCGASSGFRESMKKAVEAWNRRDDSDEYEKGFHDGIRSEATRELVEVTSKLVESVMESIRICLSNVDIEAITVKRCGHWIICSDGYSPYCSECGHRPKEMSKFCEECGADMREEGKK